MTGRITTEAEIKALHGEPMPMALVRSKLWDVRTQIERSELPGIGEMIKAFSEQEFDAEANDKS